MNFKSTMMTPPCGEYFFEHSGERVSARTWREFLPKMRGMIAKYKLVGTPLDLAAQYMCPQLPSWFCTAGGVRDTPVDVARKEARPLFAKHVVAPQEIARRLAVCQTCPRHKRTVCLTCTGIASWIRESFGGRRPPLPEDRMSGVCGCADTFEMALASVDARELPEWKDQPAKCWRTS